MLVLAVAVCLLLVGGGLVVRSAHQPARAASSGASSGASPHASASATAGSFTSPSLSGSPSGSPSDEPSLSSAASARAVELARLAEQALALSKKRRTARPVATFTMASFNTLGAVHTRHKGRANGVTRTVWMRDLLLSHDVDVVALQEFERVQVSTFVRVAGSTYDVYPGLVGRAGDAENAVAWRNDTFELMKGETRPYPYFNGQIRNMPRVLLRHRDTGVELWVTSYHNPASTRQFPHQQGWRARAVSLQIADTNALLAATRDQLIVAGDMNDRATYFCRMAGSTPLRSADGSTHPGTCRVAARPWIDWILGSRDVAFSDYRRDSSAFVRKTSDHPIVVTQVKVKGAPGAGQNADPGDGS